MNPFFYIWYMSKKFNKHRSVDSLYLNVPIKYCTEIHGAKQNSSNYIDEDALKQKYLIKKLKKLGVNKCCWTSVQDNFNSLFNILDNAYKCVDGNILNNIIDDIDKIVDKEIKENTKKDFDKEFTIIDFYGKYKALCGWRNTNTCKIGKTFILPVIYKNNKQYILYKNQKICINNLNGWII